MPSSWRIKSTATRAKSNTSSETTNEVDMGMLVAVGGRVVVTVVVVVPGILFVSVLIRVLEIVVTTGIVWNPAIDEPEAAFTGSGMMVITSTATNTATAAAAPTTAASSPSPSTAAPRTPACAPPFLAERPSNVTREFWAVQERLPELKRARISVPERGTEKFP
jgi:hypothetical protein